jgi:cytochrome d ubiquinol oxidase subunit II
VAFALNALAIGLMVANLFVGLFPRLMVSSLNPEWSLTIYNSAATDKSLTITTWLSLTLLPVIIAYQAWNYYIFRKRVTVSDGHHI